MNSGFLRLTATRTAQLLGGIAVLSALSGCAMGNLQLSGSAPASANGTLTISGTVHGGQNVVTGSTIQLYVVGSGSYGAAATAKLTKTVTSQPDGSFSITSAYTCPSSSSLVYITATGGNPGLTAGTNNAALKMAAPLGACGTLASTQFIVINEVTTAAMAFSLGQYFTTTFGSSSTDSFGAPSTTQAQVGITNAFATAAMLASIATGNAVVSTTLTGASSTLTAVPESAKLNTIANIIASCVNSDGTSTSNCPTLFADVVPTSGTTPTDTLQAAVDMSLNPTSTNANGSSANLTALYGLSQGTGAPFTGLSAQPTDWTIGIQYQDNAGTFFLKPQNIAVDSLGDVWVLSNNGGAGGLVEVGPTGTPLSNVSSLNSDGPFSSAPPALSSPKTTTTTLNMTPATLFTSTFGQAANNPSMNPRNLAIDPSNNVWFTQSSGVSSTNGGSNGTTAVAISGNVFEVATTGGLPTGSTYSFATGKSSYGLSIDATGNIFDGEQSSSAYFGFYEFPYNATAGNAIYAPAAFLPDASAAVPAYVSPDKSDNQWFSTGAGGIYEGVGLSASTCANTAATPTLCQPATTTYSYTTITIPSGANTPFSLAEGTTGMWFASQAKTTGTPGLFVIPFASTTGTLYGTANTFTAPSFVAADGAGNMWTANGVGPNSTTNTTGGSLSEVSSTGTILSPSNGGSTSIGPGYNHLGLSYGYGLAVDPSGNVWVASNAAYTASCSTTLTNTSNTCSSIFELVGAAAPTVTPIAASQATGPAKP